jgi:hypothetical protein
MEVVGPLIRFYPFTLLLFFGPHLLIYPSTHLRFAPCSMFYSLHTLHSAGVGEMKLNKNGYLI